MKTRTNISPGRGALAALAACLLALLVAEAAAAAPERTVRDPRFDTPYLSKHGRLDITKATAERRLTRVTHAVTTRAKAKPSRTRERPSILINTRGGRRSDYEYIVFGSTVFRVPRKGRPVAIAEATLVPEGPDLALPLRHRRRPRPRRRLRLGGGDAEAERPLRRRRSRRRLRDQSLSAARRPRPPAPGSAPRSAAASARRRG